MPAPAPIRSRRLAVSCFVFLSALAQTDVSTAQDEPPPAPPLAFFARMLSGEWQMRAASGTSIFRTWHWGPGQHSLRVMNDGQGAAGEPWLDFDVVYWHPARKEVRVFGVSQYARGITNGVATVDGERATVDIDLHQTGGRRRLRSELRFDGPDRHRSRLLEAVSGADDYTLLSEWELVRNDPADDQRRIEVGDAKAPSDRIRPLASLLGRWDAWIGAATAAPADPRLVRATSEWIPRADAIYIRVVEPVPGSGPIHLLDAYLYHHTGTGRLRCLALSREGGVFDGDIAVLEEGGFQFDFQACDGDRLVPGTARISIEAGEAVTLRAWYGDGADRRPVLDTTAGRRGTRASQGPRPAASGAEPTAPTPAQGEPVTEMSRSIQYVFQASSGDIWFGGGSGAYRYRDESLVRFTTRDGLCSDGVGGFQEDASGNLYLSTGGGINKFDGKVFTTLPLAAGAGYGDWKLEPDDLWFGGPHDAGVVYRFDGESLHPLVLPTTPLGDVHDAQCARWRHPNAIYSPYDVYSILKDAKGHVWFATTSSGVCRYDGRSFQWLTDRDLVGAPVRALFQDSRGNYWFSGSGAGSVGEGRPIEGFDALGTGARGMVIDGMSFAEDAAGKIWSAVYTAGAARRDESGTIEFPIRDGETPIEVFTVHRDREGAIWLGTHNGGAYRFDGKGFVRFRPGP